MKNPIALILIVIVCHSCSSTNLMSLSVLQPAPVTVPPYIKKVGIVDRSKALQENRTIDAIHKAVSLETTDLQVAGANASISGLTDQLMKNSRFAEVKALTAVELRSFGAGVFPSALSWDTVEKICRENNMDALFSLELFDTESKLSYAAVPATIHTGLANLPAIEQQVSMVTLVKNGWRIYDPSSRNILDEYVTTRDLQFTGRGINPVVAASSLIGRKEAVKQVSNNSGQAYGDRILPHWIRVSRYYYTGGDGNFTMAMRMAQTGNWDGAAKIWQQETTNASGKLAGRACYNMAIISEINGDVDGAIQWAQNAYEKYNNRLALSYVNILRNRKADNIVLKDQNAVSQAP
ncbi:MAG TPA: DUF6340 family protein [Puia sp.]